MVNTTSLTPLRLFVLIFPLLLIISCGKPMDDKTETNAAPEARKSVGLTDKGILTYTLDSLADFEHIQDLQINHIDGKDYLSYFDRPTFSIYVHDYETGQIEKKITLTQEGPNAVNVLYRLQYHLHSFDSIFIDGEFRGHFLINDKAEVLASIKSSVQAYLSDNMRITIDRSSRVLGEKIEGTIKWSARSKIELFPFLRGTLDFSSGKITKDSIRSEALFDNYNSVLDFLKKAKKKGKIHVNIHRHITRFDELIYATTTISDSVAIFRNQKAVRSIYAGLPDYKVTDYLTYLNNNEVILTKGLVDGKVILKQPPLYLSTQVGLEGRFIYRVISHGTKASINPSDGSDMPVISGATLLVINLETEERYRYELPINEIDISTSPYNPHFISNKGIHFRVKGQENEDEVEYRVFGISEGG